MKKILLTIMVGALSSLSVNAQVDYGFETWADVPNAKPGVQDPRGWASFNILTSPFVNPSMQTTVFKETAAFTGSAAAKIVTQQIPSSVPVPGYDTVGILTIGIVNFSPPGIREGTASTARPETVNFATKYEPVGLDTGFVSVHLTRYNTTSKKIETIATGLWQTSTASSTWTARALKLNYDPNFATVSPDTIKIRISSSSLYRPKINSAFYIDDITFTGSVSTNDIEGIKNNVTVFPSPAKENISFSSSVNAQTVEIMDITGRSIGRFPMTNNKVTLQTLNYESGMYIYNVLDNQRIIGRGKFEVVK